MGTHSRHSTLPVVPAAEWLPRSLIQERRVVWSLREDLVLNRQEAPEGSIPSLMEQEIAFRTAYEGYVRKVLETAKARLDKCEAEREPAEEAAKVKLRAAGFLDPIEGQRIPAAYSWRMVRRHPIVRAVLQKQNDLRFFIEKRRAARVANLRWFVELTSKLRRLRSSASVLAV
ncbi:hypothetical protein [Planctomyces sp. SH-PL14]|uniref:hypothetical protein n=1 Tax=Planctomyces sp. SH-PL14 TaxID=1632864 RepID=UPI00078CF86F|nr:hypothetical protein [Planctomyces sp. SH-PL14]AMV22324.1 hypothetical protein VT03_30770 [Planctomyces sp. SH-PL14]